MRIISVTFFLLIYLQVFSQAEIDKVRSMFGKTEVSIPVSIWKGHLASSHAVEMYLAEHENEVKGYYRIISSGESFDLIGELVGSQMILSEYNKNGIEIGIFKADEFQFSNEELALSWSDLDQTDILDLKLKRSNFSDYPESLFRPKVFKYSRFIDKEEESYLLEVLSEQELIIHHILDNEEVNYRSIATSSKPLQFNITDANGQQVFDQLTDKLRCRRQDQFIYFGKENEVEIKKISYASGHFLCDVDYPSTSNTVFNEWIKSVVETRKQKIRSELAILRNSSEEHPAVEHFSYKWIGWTEIDFLSDQLISGRIVFNSSWDGVLETIPFQFDFVENESFEILKQFRNDFNTTEYLDKYLSAALLDSSDKRYAGFKFKKEDFNILGLTAKSLVISTGFSWEYGYRRFTIPYSELEGLIKRNSILKNLM